MLSHKIRKALLDKRDLQPLSGEVDKLNRGAKRSHIFVTHLETQSVVNSFANAYIEKKSRINTDESNAYGELLLNYDLRTVNHKKNIVVI